MFNDRVKHRLADPLRYFRSRFRIGRRITLLFPVLERVSAGEGKDAPEEERAEAGPRPAKDWSKILDCAAHVLDDPVFGAGFFDDPFAGKYNAHVRRVAGPAPGH